MGGTLCTPQRRHFHLSSKLLGAVIGLLRMIPSSELSISVVLSSSNSAAIIGIRAACNKEQIYFTLFKQYSLDLNHSLQYQKNHQILRHLGQR